MNRIEKTVLGLAAVVALAAPAARLAAAPPEVLGAGPRFDLSDLRDGESRTFGEGDRTITATRRGDEVAIDLPGREAGSPKSVTCLVGKDTCFVSTPEGGHGAIVVMRKEAEGMAGHDVLVVRTAREGEGAPDGERTMVWVSDEGETHHIEGSEHAFAFATAADAVPAGQVLRCPRGDTTMTLGKDETATGYTCPKHGEPLVKVEGAKLIQKVIVRTEKAGEGEAK